MFASVVIVTMVVSVALGFYIGFLVFTEKTLGTLVVDESDPDDGPYLFLELSPEASPHVIKRKSHVYFKVEAKNYLSQK